MEYTQSRQDNLNEAVDSLELSRRFESRVYRFAHIEFLLKDGELKGEKLDFGVSNLPLAVKRLSYYAAYLEANQREKVTRASDLAAQMPKLTQAFEDDMGSLSMVETILFAKYGLYDDFEIQRHYKRVGDASHVKAIVDGGIDDKYERMFGYLEKVVKTLTQLYGIWSKQSEHNPFDHQSVESVVDAAMKAFPTYTEILKSIYADFDDHRGAAGAGASRFETNQFKEDFKEWLLMKRPADRVRDQGGMTTYEDFKEIHVWNEERPRRVFLSEILNWLATEPFNALEEDPKKRISLLDEVFRRLDQSHNPSP